MKKHRLKVDFTSGLNHSFIGISSTAPDYKLCWEINNSFSIHLVKTEPHQITEKSGEKHSFPKFYYDDENTLYSFTLIHNKEDNRVLISDLKTVDYILILEGDISDTFKQNCLKQLRDIPLIVAAIDFTDSNIRYKERLFIN